MLYTYQKFHLYHGSSTVQCELVVKIQCIAGAHGNSNVLKYFIPFKILLIKLFIIGALG